MSGPCSCKTLDEVVGKYLWFPNYQSALKNGTDCAQLCMETSFAGAKDNLRQLQIVDAGQSLLRAAGAFLLANEFIKQRDFIHEYLRITSSVG